MKVLVTGNTGQLGYDVVRLGEKLGLDIIGTGSGDLDITIREDVLKYIGKVNPDAIIHCAAYTAVDNAENDKDTCSKVNVGGTNNLVIAAKENNIKFMYISTDYVFNGKGQIPYTENDKTNPLGFYGETKLSGENIVATELSEWFIVRISWVFGINGNNFVKTMLKLAESHIELNVVGDQIGSPTYTYDLARLLLDMIQSEKYGVYHATNEGFCSWSDFAKEIFWQAKKNVKVNSVSSEEYPTQAERPKNSRMSKQKLINNGFDPLPKWQEAITHFLNEVE